MGVFPLIPPINKSIPQPCTLLEMPELGKGSPQIHQILRSIILKTGFSSIILLFLIDEVHRYNSDFLTDVLFFNTYKLIGHSLMLKHAGKGVIVSSFQGTNFIWVTSIL